MSFLMKYEIIPLYLPNKTKRRPGIFMEKVLFGVSHDTGNSNSTARENVKFYTNTCNDQEASAHIFVDDKDIIEVVPFLTGKPEKAWHVLYNITLDNNLFGDDANDVAFGVELCYGSNINFTEAYKRYIWVIAYAFYKSGVDPSRLTGHFILDPKRKTDPKSGLATGGKTFEQLQKDVINEYNSCLNNGSTVGKGVSQVGSIAKERIYAENGVLKRADGNYKIPATDVRYIKFDKGTYKLKLVWAQNKTVSQLVRENGADYGFNFPFFYNGDPIADCKIGNQVLGTGYDTPGGAQQTKWHGFAWKNGQPVIGELNINDDYTDGFLVKTTPFLISNGQPGWDWYRQQEGTAPDIGKDANGNYVRAQRTFIGLDTQGNLHLAVGDGRTSYDRGLTLEEMSLYMVSKGVVNALNGDGGSSSVIADKTGSLGQNQGIEERAVNHAVLVFLNPVAPPPPPTQGGTTVEQWKLDTLKALSLQTQKDGSPFVDYETWKDKLDTTAPVWLMFELIKRVLEKQ